jgi:Leucine-rich repeat (LRR) protein
MPGIIPTEVGGLTGLQTLRITGNGEIPAGDFPSSIKSLTALSTLELQSTGMNALPDDVFSSLRSVSTLLLSGNLKFAGGLPSTLALSSLRSL